MLRRCIRCWRPCWHYVLAGVGKQAHCSTSVHCLQFISKQSGKSHNEPEHNMMCNSIMWAHLLDEQQSSFVCKCHTCACRRGCCKASRGTALCSPASPVRLRDIQNQLLGTDRLPSALHTALSDSIQPVGCQVTVTTHDSRQYFALGKTSPLPSGQKHHRL